MKSAKLKLVFVCVCFGLLFLPLLNHIFHFDFEVQIDENRTTNDSLTFSFSKLDAFPEECEVYLQDNFNFRGPVLKMNNVVFRDWMHVSPAPDRVIIGKNGRYFSGGEVAQDFNGVNLFSKDELRLLRTDWKKRAAFIQKNKAKVFFIVAPTALDVYSNDLPFYVINKSGINRRKQLINELSFIKQLQIIDPTVALISKRSNPNLYFKYDNHWSQAAGKLTAKLLIQKMQQMDVDIQGHFIDQIRSSKIIKRDGYFKNVLLLDQISQSVDEYHSKAQQVEKFGFKIPEGFMYPDSFEKHFKNPHASNKKKVLIICDSFGDALIPFINEGFEETLWIFDNWEYKLNETIIETYQPDIIIFEVYSPHLKNLLQ